MDRSTRRPWSQARVNRVLLWLFAALAIAEIGTAMFAGSGVAAATTGSSSGRDGATSSESPKPSTKPASGKAEGVGATAVHESNRSAGLGAIGTSADTGRSTHASPQTQADPAGGSIIALPGRVLPVLSTVPESTSSTAPAKQATTRPHAKNTADGQIKPAVPSPDTDAAHVGPTDATAWSRQQIGGKVAQATVEASRGTSSVADTATTADASSLTAASAASPAFTSAVPAPKPATVIDLIGTVIFSVLNVGLQLFEGPPVLPPGSTVTVATSTLQLGCASSACTVPADWYFPADPTPQGLIYLQHGFLANAPMYSYTAALLAQETDSIVVAPSLTSNLFATDGLWLGGAPMQQAVANLFVGDRAALTDSASAAAGHPVTLPQRVVLVGHSLGGSLVAAVAGDMADNGSISNLAGVVLLDGVALDPTLIATAVAKVPPDLPILMIASPPYWLNNFGQTVTDLVNARPGQFNGVQLVGGKHLDYMEGGNLLVQLAAYLVGGFSLPQNIDAVQTLASGWINDMFAGTHNGIYGVPGQAIQIPTSAGPATAIALPAPNPFAPVDALLAGLVDLAFGSIANFEPTSGFALV